jgi:hypothetical protein
MPTTADAKALVLKALSPEENDIISKLVSSDESAEQLIPEDIAVSQLWQYLNLSAKMIYQAQEAISRLKPILGRLLIILEKHPELYRSYGYETYDDFMSRGMPQMFGVSRSESYAAKKIGKALSFLDQEELTKIGFSKANALASALNRVITPDMTVDMVEEKRQEWVKRATDGGSLAEFKIQMVSDGLIEPGETEYVVLALRVNRSTRDHWAKFCNNPDVKSYCETTEQGTILERLMQEAEGEWTARLSDSARG